MAFNDINISDIKQRFGIIGQDEKLLRAIETAVEVAPIQLSVLIIGESGSGKESFPQIIHQYSRRKHKQYVAVNCGAIPEGTIDSELFGHEKGSFTGALSDRKGYFEEADGGTIFLDEIGELPLQTQAKLLRVLERGEYMRVGSSAVRKTDVRIVAATNVDLETATSQGRFREDLFYRLNGIMIRIPPLRQRKADIPSLFHKFTNDFADRNKMPPVRLTPDAQKVLTGYHWPGNVRQLKNVAEQITVLARSREVDAEAIAEFMPRRADGGASLIMAKPAAQANTSFNNEREILYKVLFDMRRDMNDLKKLVMQLLAGRESLTDEDRQIISRLYQSPTPAMPARTSVRNTVQDASDISFSEVDYEETAQEPLPIAPKSEAEPESKNFSITDNERELIRQALEKHQGKRKQAAEELGISERTLYRRIMYYGL